MRPFRLDVGGVKDESSIRENIWRKRKTSVFGKEKKMLNGRYNDEPSRSTLCLHPKCIFDGDRQTRAELSLFQTQKRFPHPRSLLVLAEPVFCMGLGSKRNAFDLLASRSDVYMSRVHDIFCTRILDHAPEAD